MSGGYLSYCPYCFLLSKFYSAWISKNEESPRKFRQNEKKRKKIIISDGGYFTGPESFYEIPEEAKPEGKQNKTPGTALLFSTLVTWAFISTHALKAAYTLTKKQSHFFKIENLVIFLVGVERGQEDRYQEIGDTAQQQQQQQQLYQQQLQQQLPCMLYMVRFRTTLLSYLDWINFGQPVQVKISFLHGKNNLQQGLLVFELF